MRQGTSATITCHVSPVEYLSGNLEIRVVVLQDSTGVCYVFSNWEGHDGNITVDADAGTVSCTLSREQSAAFEVGTALVQVIGEKSGQIFWASSIAKINVNRTLKGF